MLKTLTLTLLSLIAAAAVLVWLIPSVHFKDDVMALKTDPVRLSTGTVQQALLLFAVHHKRFPTESESLAALVAMPPDLRDRWRGPYLAPVHLKDPWGQSFRYTRSGEDALLHSSGPDAVADTADDLKIVTRLPSLNP